MKSRTVEETRLLNLRAIAARKGGVTALAKELGKSQSQLQNTIGKTPIKALGSDLARDVEEQLRLDRGFLDMPWDMAEEARMVVAGSDEELPPELDVARFGNDIAALQFICGAIVNTLAASRPDEARGVKQALLKVDEKFQIRGPIYTLLQGLNKALAKAEASAGEGAQPSAAQSGTRAYRGKSRPSKR